jgi:hypothetical protein
VVELFPPKDDAEALGKEPTLLYTIRAGSCTRAESISTDGGMSCGPILVVAAATIQPASAAADLSQFYGRRYDQLICLRPSVLIDSVGMSWSKAVVAPSPMNVDPGR